MILCWAIKLSALQETAAKFRSPSAISHDNHILRDIIMAGITAARTAEWRMAAGGWRMVQTGIKVAANFQSSKLFAASYAKHW